MNLLFEYPKVKVKNCHFKFLVLQASLVLTQL